MKINIDSDFDCLNVKFGDLKLNDKFFYKDHYYEKVGEVSLLGCSSTIVPGVIKYNAISTNKERNWFILEKFSNDTIVKILNTVEISTLSPYTFFRIIKIFNESELWLIWECRQNYVSCIRVDEGIGNYYFKNFDYDTNVIPVDVTVNVSSILIDTKCG